MAITNGYATRQNFKDLFAISGSTLDDEIDRAVEAASRLVDRYTHRRFWQDSTVVVRVYTPTDSQTLITDDISTTTGLVVKTDDNWDGTYENTWTEDDRTGSYGYALEPANAGDDSKPFTRLIALAGAWPRLRYGVQVTAKFGWAAVPTEVAQATLLLARRVHQRKDVPFGIQNSPDLGEPILLRRADPDVSNLLDPFCRWDI